MHSLLLYGRPNRSEPFLGNITHIARGWRRSSRAVGGYWAGSFSVTDAEMNTTEMTDFYNRNIGCIVREYAGGGLLAWEGYILEMRLVLDGLEHMRSMLPEWWHNRVNVKYTWPAVTISQAVQGNWTWDPNAPQDGCEDDAYDFSPYQTSAPGAAAYMLEVYCTQVGYDPVYIWGFMGDVGAGGNTEIDIYEDSGLTDEGWAVDHVPGGRANKTAVSYKIIDVTRSGKPTATGWSANTDASDEYGEMEYIEIVGSTQHQAAAELRDRHLAEFAWPRSRLVGSATSGQHPPAARLLVTVAGFWHTLNWQYLETTKAASCWDLINYVVPLSEFVTVGRAERNYWQAIADCQPMPQRLGDLCADIINLGDESSNIWHGGVYAEKTFRYEAAPTTVEYQLIKGVLSDKNGVAQLPPLVEPGFLVRVPGVLVAGQPPGASNVWDDPQVAYVDEVEFVAPNTLKLRLHDQEEGIITLLEQARMHGMGEAYSRQRRQEGLAWGNT